MVLEDAVAVGHGGEGEVGKGVHHTALTHASSVEMVCLYAELRLGHASLHVDELSADAGSESVLKIEFF